MYGLHYNFFVRHIVFVRLCVILHTHAHTNTHTHTHTHTRARAHTCISVCAVCIRGHEIVFFIYLFHCRVMAWRTGVYGRISLPGDLSYRVDGGRRWTRDNRLRAIIFIFIFICIYIGTHLWIRSRTQRRRVCRRRRLQRAGRYWSINTHLALHLCLKWSNIFIYIYI